MESVKVPLRKVRSVEEKAAINKKVKKIMQRVEELTIEGNKIDTKISDLLAET